MRQKTLAVLALALATAGATVGVLGGPPRNVGTGEWDRPGPFDHSAWNGVLERFVDDQGLVDYPGLSRDREELDRYVQAIADIGPETRPDLFPDRDDRLAYYINAYNALVFLGVLERGPEVNSVWSGGPVSGAGFFGIQKFTVDGRVMNLHALENEVIRKRFADPRIHAALNCASIGCPRLPRRAFAGSSLDADLDAAMTAFVASERNVSIDHERKTVTLNRIFDWFEFDFLIHERGVEGNWGGSLVDYINRFRAPGAEIPAGYRVKVRPFDKRLNRQGSSILPPG